VTRLGSVRAPELATLRVRVDAPRSVILAGTITCKDPGGEVGPFIRALHDAALADGLAELHVDVRELSFVNSSAIRLFIDWASWLKAAPASRYQLRFTTKRGVTWQRTSFMALKSLANDVLSVEQVD